MNPMRWTPLLLAALVLPACAVDNKWEDFTLERAPFANAWVDRADATFEIMLADGYVCPDGAGARVYLLEPSSPVDPATPRPLALLLHGRNFDAVADDGAHLDGENRLNAAWSSNQVETTLGMESSLGTTGQGEGAWAAALLERGFAVVVPANCWGDLWHGTGRNAYDEGFLRLGSRLADEAVTLASARPGISGDQLVVVALSEGGRGLVELIADGPPIAAAFVDSSPDWLSPLVAQPSVFRDELAALAAIYDDEVGDIADPPALLGALRVSLERDTLVTSVRDLGFRAPIVYAWSSLDERIDPAWAQPAADIIATTYPAADAQVLDWGISDHAPSNRDPVEAGARLDWLLGRLPAPAP